MPSLSELHNELRLRVPNKPSEFYNDALRWSIDKICRNTSVWEVITTLTTVADKSVYDLDIPSGTVIHSNLKIIQKGNIDRTVLRPVNGGFSNLPASDYLQSFDTFSKNEIAITTPVLGGETLKVYTAVKPTRNTTTIHNEKFFNEYSDTVVEGALYRCFDLDGNIPMADREMVKFKNGIDSIHVDVLKRNANTSNRLYAGW